MYWAPTVQVYGLRRNKVRVFLSSTSTLRPLEGEGCRSDNDHTRPDFSAEETGSKLTKNQDGRSIITNIGHWSLRSEQS